MEGEQGRYRIYDDDAQGERTASEVSYGRDVRRKSTLILGGVIAMAATVLVSLVVGMPSSSVADILVRLVTFDTGDIVGWKIWRIYMPIMAAAMITGGGLALSGTVMQCILRNPLASPYTLGLSSAAAFGAAFAILFLDGGSATSRYISVSSPYVTTACAFGFAMVATAVILLLTRITRVSAETMVLAGIAISAIFSAGLTLMQYMADSTQLGAIVSWTFGNLGKADWGWDAAIFFVGVPIVIYFMLNRWSLNAMNAGDEVAEGVGVGTARFRMIGLVLSALLSSILVAGFGVIAFVGLLGPHISRMIVGSDHRSLIPMSLVLGAAIMLIADTVARTAMSPMVLPVGILTSLLGGPLFIYLLLSRSRRRTYV